MENTNITYFLQERYKLIIEFVNSHSEYIKLNSHTINDDYHLYEITIIYSGVINNLRLEIGNNLVVFTSLFSCDDDNILSNTLKRKYRIFTICQLLN